MLSDKGEMSTITRTCGINTRYLTKARCTALHLPGERFNALGMLNRPVD
jgi:hypothetical protein